MLPLLSLSISPGIKVADKEAKYEKIKERKRCVSAEMLCKGFPSEFVTYMNYCRGLRFDEKPDYSYLRKLFRDCMMKMGFQHDYVFDWTKNTSGHAQEGAKMGFAATQERLGSGMKPVAYASTRPHSGALKPRNDFIDC